MQLMAVTGDLIWMFSDINLEIENQQKKVCAWEDLWIMLKSIQPEGVGMAVLLLQYTFPWLKYSELLYISEGKEGTGFLKVSPGGVACLFVLSFKHRLKVCYSSRNQRYFCPNSLESTK